MSETEQTTSSRSTLSQAKMFYLCKQLELWINTGQLPRFSTDDELAEWISVEMDFKVTKNNLASAKTIIGLDESSTEGEITLFHLHKQLEETNRSIREFGRSLEQIKSKIESAFVNRVTVVEQTEETEETKETL